MKTLRLLVRGRVQGVGFRPFLVRLAEESGVSGQARNVPEGVEILVSGPPGALSDFLRELLARRPPLSRIRALSVRALPPQSFSGFAIADSTSGPPSTLVPPDVATCAACLSEVRDPSDRRFGYPFTNCTDCGPRYTVIEALPYDRARTSMREFPMCPDCLREYRNPRSRRFHAEPNACPRCGPGLWICDRRGTRIPVRNLWEFVVRTLREGAIWAIKGLGGFHLVCDAENERVVRLLRRRKRRPTKPFAVMVRDLETAGGIAELSPAETEVLSSPEAPIVLARKARPFPLAEAVAPGLEWVGIMLPYTPLHHLLLSAWPGKALVMTSGNLSEEPLCFENDEALRRLSELADFFLFHDRRIVNPVDDSVVRFCDSRRILIRRARGFVPEPLELPRERTGLLGVGALLKNTFTLTRGGEAFPGPHLGDLEALATLELLRRTLSRYQALLSVEPEVLISDLHPDYLSSRFAEDTASRKGLALLKLQHHAAHAYAALGGRAGGKALALVLDGAGLGADGTIWGGEILFLEGQRYRRVGGISPFPLPGGEAAEREPWRVALALLSGIFGPGEAVRRLRALAPDLPMEAVELVALQTERGLNTPLTSSAGRLFEAAAVLLGLGLRNGYEGELALRLEGLASEIPEEESGGSVSPDTENGRIRGTALIEAVLRDLEAGVPRNLIAFRFHRRLAAALLETVNTWVERLGVREVALSGGCFQNALLLKMVAEGLEARGLEPIFSESVPPNDGGISYGQVVWASLVQAFQGLGP
ncbi:carbamoyltransferase HypF [Thermosulfurimonas sp. F29]|uniref:carbamoyltransferase HypF n=1 Tax=Thermosulfurimonas sp. F29 TaxID=2867247 RepID=UPI001C83AA89|nr:carbamoyltransferase HypF [Thermosulfurimonas sp. F29]MBX6424041.1 carbamoyltransferase HypF [Thermosulfurimonas sp. F29]